MKVWTTNGMVRVRRGDAPTKSMAPVPLAAGRGEWESFQIIVQGPARNVRVEAQISGLGVELYRQHFVEVKEGTAPWDWDTTTQPRTAHPEPPGWIPDAWAGRNLQCIVPLHKRSRRRFPLRATRREDTDRLGVLRARVQVLGPDGKAHR